MSTANAQTEATEISERASLLAAIGNDGTDALDNLMPAEGSDQVAAADATEQNEDGTPPSSDDAGVENGQQIEAKDGAPKVEADPKRDKAKDREARTWERINAEKQKLAQERAEIERMRREAEEAREDAATKPRFSPEDFEAIAREAKDRGDELTAQTATAEAEKLRAEQNARVQRKQAATVRQQQDADLRELLKDYPDLAKPESALAQEVERVFKETPELLQHAKGLRFGITTAVGKTSTTTIGSLTAENAKLKTELAALRAKFEPGDGGMVGAPSGDAELQPGTAAFDKALKAQLAQAESSGTWAFG
jgi:flagellar biosynthesis GTPase FlhF